MFGGLEVKGTSSKEKDENKTAAAAASSGFSFMAGGATPAPAPATEGATTSSAFSFMATNAAPSAIPEKAPEKSSGFSFMTTTTTTPAPAPPPAKPAAESSAPSRASAGFDFLQTPAQAATEPAMKAPSSSFSFMSRVTTEPEPQSSMTSTGLGPTEKQPSAPPALSSSASPEPLGSGVVFGGASAATKKPIKKRNRAVKVGAGRTEMPAPTNAAPPRPSYAAPEPTAAAPSVPAYGSSSATRSTTTSSSPPRPANYTNIAPQPAENEKSADIGNSGPHTDTKTAAMESVNRAEEFIASKLQKEQDHSSTIVGGNSSSSGYVEDYGSSTPPRPTTSTTVWAQSPEEDDDYATAKAAAEEAQAQLASGRPNASSDGLMGRLFSRKAPWHGSAGSFSNSSQHSLPTVTPSETPSERMQREQEEIKRAVAERQLAMQQKQQQDQSATPFEEEGTTQTVEIIDKPSTTEAESYTSPSQAGSTTSTNNLTRTTSWTRPTMVATSPPSPPPKTPSEKLEEILQGFEKKVQEAMARVDHMRDHHKGLLDERRLSLAKERLATQSMAAAEAQQMQAAEAEDYDLADRLGAVIDGHAREKQELATILDNIGRALDELDSRKQEVVGEVALCFARVKDELSEFQHDQESNDKKDDTESMKKFASVAKQLSAEQDRLSTEDKHIQREENYVIEDRKEVELSISEQTADMEKQRDSARASLMTVEEEIEILRRQLETKEATAKTLREEVDRHEADIKKIRDKFSRQLTRVEKKEASVKENRYEWEKEKIAHDAARLAHDKEVQAHHSALVNHEALMEKLRKEITLAASFETIVAKEVMFDKTADQNMESDDDFAQLQADVVKSEATVSEGKQFLKAAEASFNDLKDERDSLMKQIPKLEETKTAAAARRDFKAAGKASKQIKDATARLKECQEELKGEARDRKDAALEDLVKLEEDLKAKQAILKESEKKAGKHVMEELANKITRLAETKKNVCGGAMDAMGIQAVGAYVLNGQIEALMREGSAYGEKFGGWEIIADELAASGIFDTSVAMSSGSDAKVDGMSRVGRPADEVDPEIISKFREATRRLQNVEEAIDAAVARDDFESADKLNEELEQLKVEWQAIDLTEAEVKVFEGSTSDSIGSDREENGADANEPAAVSLSSDDESHHEEDDASDSANANPNEGDSRKESTGGDSGYVSEEGTELIDDSEHDSTEDKPSGDEEPTKSSNVEVNGKNDVVEASDEKDNDEPVEGSVKQDDAIEQPAEGSVEQDDATDQPVENGTDDKTTEALPEAHESVDEAAVKENGH